MTNAPHRLRVGKQGLHVGLAGLALASGLALFPGMAHAAGNSAPLPTTEDPGPGPTREGGIRTYRERNAQGVEVLYITNLDESGRRIGGEVERTVMPDTAATQCLREEAVDPGPPVIVNIYTLAPAQAIFDGYDSTESRFVNYGYARFPGAYPSPHHIHGQERRHMNAGQPAGFFGRPRVIDTRPYSQAPASRRNRVYFRQN